MAHSLHQELRKLEQHRVSVYWRCGEAAACSSGILIEVGYDFIELLGIVPTLLDDENGLPVACTDPQGLLLQTIIPMKSVFGLIEDIPIGRKATLPRCCTEDAGAL